MIDLWSFTEQTGYAPGTDLVGFDVEATDGKIGSVDEETSEVGAAHIVVDTGFWIFGKHVLLPAGTIHRIDLQERKIHAAKTKEEIRNAPEYDKDKHRDDAAYRVEIGQYYEDNNERGV
ncbi:PRC-barrel domain-containing protein [Streptomyces sp. NBC_01426]|uniref:PRC-barrel domain-containing protein n=1 Tax=Streptomyces sp. NBC_01426 TaxID=2975866 RepID=UPI002E310B4D|nr:PRC-barrel domain-containing protein [Streptomyces sp. NBC_01426]